MSSAYMTTGARKFDDCTVDTWFYTSRDTGFKDMHAQTHLETLEQLVDNAADRAFHTAMRDVITGSIKRVENAGVNTRVAELKYFETTVRQFLTKCVAEKRAWLQRDFRARYRASVCWEQRRKVLYAAFKLVYHNELQSHVAKLVELKSREVMNNVGLAQKVAAQEAKRKNQEAQSTGHDEEHASRSSEILAEPIVIKNSKALSDTAGSETSSGSDHLGPMSNESDILFD